MHQKNSAIAEGNMKIKNVEDFSWLYALLKPFASFMHNHVFYKKVYTSGLENIPEEGAVIFAPNHQNALMDALIILSVKNWQPVFMARADIFAGQFVRRLLFFMKILPIFRIRDGRESLKQNDEIFEKSVQVLRKKRYLVIYPEASHVGRRRLRPLKKGITRIAFMAEEASNYTLGVKIVPVGINYQDYFSFRTNAFINFGKPINVEDYRDLYLENPQKANHELITDISNELKSLIINIENNEEYDNFETARLVYAPYLVKKERKLVNNFKNRIYAGQQVVKLMDTLKNNDLETFHKLNGCLSDYRKLLQQENLRDWIIRRRFTIPGVLLRTVILIAMSPVALFGAVNNFLPYHTPDLFTRKIKDKNFHTSIRFAVYMFVFPLIFYPLIFFLLCQFTDSWLIRLIYMLLLPPTGIFAFHYFEEVKRVLAMWRYTFNRNKKSFECLRWLREQILDIFKSIENNS